MNRIGRRRRSLVPSVCGGARRSVTCTAGRRGVSEAARLEELRRGAEEDLLDARLACGEHREVAAAAEALVSAEPLRERRWAILALAQYRCGRQGDALRTLHRARRTLVEQLGIDPSRELSALEAAILDQDEGLDAHVEPAAVSEACPYKGLAAYDVDDHESFFGRDTQVAACLERLRTTPLLVVTGASGCGKSSLVRAGLAPALSHPADRPWSSSSPALTPSPRSPTPCAAAGEHGTLIVDQFEELFAVGVPPGGASGFCAALAEHAAAGSVGDRGDPCRPPHRARRRPRSRQLAERGLHFVTPLAGDELRAAIEEPARRARACGSSPGSSTCWCATPRASRGRCRCCHTRWWRRGAGGTVTCSRSRATGRRVASAGAVARSADRLYDSLPAEQRPLLRSLMLRLVAPSLEGDPVRCRVATSALRGDPARERVVALLVRARLVTTEEDTVELAHEALARAWPRLRSWLDDDSAGQRILRHLAAAADGWESLGRPDSELYRGARLDTALEYRQQRRPRPDRGRNRTSSTRRNGKPTPNATRSLPAPGSTHAATAACGRCSSPPACCSSSSLVAGLLAVRSGQQAHDQRDLAQAAEDDAQLESLVNRSLALRATDRDVAALLAVEAARRWPDDPRATSALLGTFTAAHGFLGHRYVADAEWLDGALVPGTSTAVIAPDGGRLALSTSTRGEIDARFPPPDDDSTGLEIRVSADGRSVVQLRGASATGVSTSPAWNRPTVVGARRSPSTRCRRAGGSSARSRRPSVPATSRSTTTGSLVAVVGGYDGDLVLYRTADGAELGRVAGPARPETRNRSSTPQRSRSDPTVSSTSARWPGRSGSSTLPTCGVVRTIDATPFASNRHVSVGSDGIVVAAGDEALVAADVSTGAIRWTVDIRGTHPEPCPYFAASVAAGRLYCGNFFGVIEERDRTTGQRTGVTLDPQLGGVGPLAITDDGDELVSFGAQPRPSRGGGSTAADSSPRKVAEGHVAADGYDFVDGSTLVVATRRHGHHDRDFDDFALWDPPPTERSPPSISSERAPDGWDVTPSPASPACMTYKGDP